MAFLGLDRFWRSSVTKSNGEGDRQEDHKLCEDTLIRAAALCEGFDAAEELEHAIRHSQSPDFARTRRRLYPLSRQILDEIKSQYSIDDPAFCEADRIRARIESRTVWLRLTTGFLALVFSAFAFVAARNYFGVTNGFVDLSVNVPILAWFSGLTGNLATFCISVSACGLLLTFVRRFVRNYIFMSIDKDMSKFSHDLASRWDAINTRVIECCLAAQKRGTDWNLRSKLYTIVANWNAKRSEYLDRYSTIAAWKIHQFVAWAEIGANTFKWGIGASVLAWATHHVFTTPAAQTTEGWAAVLLLGAIMYATLYLGFFKLGRVPNDRWTEVLRCDIAKSEKSEKHYFLRLGELVENLSRTVLEVQRTPPNRPETRDPMI